MTDQDIEDGRLITCPACKGYGYFTWTGTPTVDRRLGRKCLDCRGAGTIPNPALLRTRPFPIKKAIEITTPRQKGELMQANDLIRELLEVLTAREWLTKVEAYDWGTRDREQDYCPDCTAIAETHAPNCRYVAAVRAAREFLAIPPVAKVSEPMAAAADAIRKAMPGLPVYEREALVTDPRPSGTITLPSGATVTFFYEPKEGQGRFEMKGIVTTPIELAIEQEDAT